MRVSQFLVTSSLLLTFASAEVMAQSMARKCPKPTEMDSLTPAERTKKFSRELVLKTTGIQATHLDQFLFEYEKFPQSLREEMRNEGATIHLVYGEGVTADPTWGRSMFTKDGRDWSKVPGSGGAVYSFPKNPTRIVVNHLYDRHGSVNLVLHEHAHTLDHLYSEKDLSASKAWKALIEDEQNQNVMRGICGYYCLTDVRESFAELFAYYHACEETREHMEQVLPTIADFMRNLTNVKEFKQANKEEQREERRVRRRNRDNNNNDSSTQTEQPRRRKTVGSFFRGLFKDIEEIFE